MSRKSVGLALVLAGGLSAWMPSAAYAQGAPVVSNVRASQRGDGSRLVDIRYDLAHNAACTVWPVLSGDAGVSWSVPAMTLTGDIGPGVSPGTFKHIIWDAAADIPGVVGTYRARVYADDGSTVSNMVFVPAGTFPYQGNFAQQIFVGSFFIDKYEMTNQRYAEFLNDADPDGTHWNANMEITRSGTPPSVYYAVNPGRQNYPIRYVSALDAEANAAWLSAREGKTYRLPTNQEWEKAAAWDPIQQKHWTFGFQSEEISCVSANHNTVRWTCGDYSCWNDGGGPCVSGTTEVGHYDGLEGTNNSHSFYGCYDMSGNVREWTSSVDGLQQVIRNCSWSSVGYFQSSPYTCTTTWYQSSAPVNMFDDVGFRLVLDPN
jgi:formylglycine-generating enzyme required for sulfatase activity